MYGKLVILQQINVKNDTSIISSAVCLPGAVTLRDH